MSPDEAGELRDRAEERLRQEQEEDALTREGAPLSPEEVRSVLHDLRVHRIELEIQNEELRRIQEELEASRERYFELYDMAPVAYFTLSEKGMILEANLTAARLLGVGRAEFVGRPITGFIAPESQDTFYRHRRALFESGSAEAFELRLRRAGGEVFDGRLSATLADGDDAPVCRVVVSDITERTRAEAERLALEQRLKEAEKADSLDRMAGAISHHFNNLLGVAIGNLELVLDDAAVGDEPDERLADALGAARSAARVSGMLLTYVGQASSEPTTHDLSEVCRFALSALLPSAPPGTATETSLPSPGPQVRVGSDQLGHVLEQLLTNAWEAVGPEGGKVRVEVGVVDRDDVPIQRCHPPGWSAPDPRYARMAVIDSGPGVEPAIADQIFDPFVSSKEFGRGLGLSVAQGVVKARGGAIAVTSGSARGSTVEVFLPLAAEGSPGPDEGAPIGELEGTILLVDDEPMLRSVGSRMLARLGLEVLTAEDGAEALRVFEEHEESITCVICDLTMPGMSGWDTVAALRKRSPGLRIVLTSGYDEARSMAMSGDHAERPQAFLSKPWELSRLAAVLTVALHETLDG